MWTSSISRIALSTSLAVAGGLSLVGVLVSLPEQASPPARPAASTASPQPGPTAAARQTPELARAIDRVDAVLSAQPETALASAVVSGKPSADAESWSGTLEPDELAAIAPAAGRPAPGAAGATTERLLSEVAERPAQVGEAAADQEAVPGAYVASTIHAGAEAAATPPANAKMAAKPGENEAAGTGSAAQASAGGNEPAGYVIIGSFRQHENAARHVSDHRTWLPQILTKDVAGRLQYRVAIGPFAKADLPAARQRIIAGGIPDAWLLSKGRGVAAIPLQTLDILG